jgi:hypothetical protein
MTVNEKYIVFKRREFMQTVGDIDGLTERYEGLEVPDAVVIRRQDKFASPCLATYASMIALVAQNISDTNVGKELLAIADYFEDQAQLAAAEGYKLPDR